MGFTNSPLVSYTQLSPNNSGQRTHEIDRITPHCVVGQLSVETLGSIFAPTSRQASCQYGIGSDGRVGMYVEEKNRAWTSSSKENDQRAVTIECACDKNPPYAFNDTVYNKLIDLCVDICKRNGKTILLWFGDKTTTLNYVQKPNEMVLTVHRWFKAKSCPGDWLMSKMTDLATKVNLKLGAAGAQTQPTEQKVAQQEQKQVQQPVQQTTQNTSGTMYAVQVGAFRKKENAEQHVRLVKSKGFDTLIKEVDNLYKVQIGAYSTEQKAKEVVNLAKSKGLSAIISKINIKKNDTVNNNIKLGDTVKIKKGAKTYTNESLASYVYDWNLIVKEITKDRVVVTYNGTIIAAMRISDLVLVE